MTQDKVRLFEVGPRDGLQNETRILSPSDKIQFIRSLLDAGVTDVEIGAFVRPDRVPQMADTDKIYKQIQLGKLDMKSARSWCLVPNMKGLERALRVGATNLVFFTAATETFCKRNIGMTIQKSIDEFRNMIQLARSVVGKRLQIRGSISTSFGCPFEGRVPPAKTLRVVEKISELGVDHISIADTIGVATPRGVVDVLRPALRSFGKRRIGVHFHDTRGTALANSLRSIDLGVRILDSSAGGLGGCPFAPGAGGNLASEDLVYMLDGMGLETGIDLNKLCKSSYALSKKMKRSLTSKYLQAYASASQKSR